MRDGGSCQEIQWLEEMVMIKLPGDSMAERDGHD
jgi:hypothetical protein